MSTFFLQFLLGLLQYVVGVDVDPHSQCEDSNSQHCTPGVASIVAFTDQSLEEAIGEGERESRQQYLQRHLGFRFHPPRVNDVTVDVVKNEQSIGQSERVALPEQEVGGPEQVGELEEEPANSGLDVDFGEGRQQSAVIDFDASEDEPAHDGVAYHNVEAHRLQTHLHPDRRSEILIILFPLLIFTSIHTTTTQPSLHPPEHYLHLQRQKYH